MKSGETYSVNRSLKRYCGITALFAATHLQALFSGMLVQIEQSDYLISVPVAEIIKLEESCCRGQDKPR
jgi:hypothetical protein